MAYQVYQRTPKGSAKNYIDTSTSEIISARQYRNRTEAAKSGFANLSQKQRLQKLKYTVETHSRVGSVHHIYDVEPKRLKHNIANVIQSSPQFGYAMQLMVILSEPVEGIRVRNGKAEKRTRTEISSYVHGKDVNEVEDMINELLVNMNKYNIPVLDIIGYKLHLIDVL